MFGHFAKAIVRQKLNGYKMVDSDQPTKRLIRLHVKETGTNNLHGYSHLTLDNSFHSHEYGKN